MYEHENLKQLAKIFRIDQITEKYDLNSRERAVYRLLLLKADSDYTVTISKKAIGDSINRKMSTATLAINALEKKGIIEKKINPTPIPNTYTLILETNAIYSELEMEVFRLLIR
jgi:predicted transcriptional regulator